ncbi:DUF3943 domain-containing protein [Roseateles violae]|uniref:DUF3943 domain-containing protein n=1 Tax=Roseateles violae TaxID=3058042 RepID=A0ABT8DSK9_9BURK|nr:DUF3943 domain-containing protein [Pelomonas sp. PFR6]MDN3921309.1 DUF3943 domain-containing protein [Pelomonas sp. PFR6]
MNGRLAAAALLLSAALPPSTAGAQTNEAEPAPSTEPAPDTAGIQRDTAYFVAYQFAAVGLISLWPQSETHYSKEIGFDRWYYNVTHPHWDSDRAVVNYVLHPYWGAGYYTRARERGLGRGNAFWYSALLSTIFEYGAEAMVEQVSYQDLIVTPVLGSLLGEYVFTPLRQRVRAKDGPLDGWDRLTLILTDPLGSINEAVDASLGIQSQLTLAPQWAAPARHPGWGLQWRIVW